MENITDSFLNEIDKIYNSNFSDKIVGRVKELILDYICVTLAGTKFNQEKLRNYMDFAEPEAGRYTVLGTGNKVALKDAVFLNGLNAHALDYDDGTNAGIIHLGAPIFSVLLPLTQKYNIDNQKLMRAIIAGYETSFTMAYSIQPGHKQRGYHATGTCGVLGATIAISYALDFTPEERKNAFATACVSATGMLMVLDGDSELKPYNVAKTALLALTSAQVAKSGFKGHDDPLSGERGYLAMMTGSSDVKLEKVRLNGTYAVEKTYTKPYAACRYCHPAIECAIQIKKDMDLHGVALDEIEQIMVKTYSLAVKGHDHSIIPNVSSAKMSIPYGVAVGLIKGCAGLNEYNDTTIVNELVLNILSKISIVEDEMMSRVFPQKQKASVEVLARGNIYQKDVDYPKGEPENPLNENEFKSRFYEMCRYADKEDYIIDKLYNGVLSGRENLSFVMDI